MTKHPLCEKLEQEWQGCGWFEALPASLKRLCLLDDKEPRDRVEIFLREDEGHYEWLLNLPTRNPIIAKRCRESLIL
jgi:rubrerythrin